jgi:hypothetical protein
MTSVTSLRPVQIPVRFSFASGQFLGFILVSGQLTHSNRSLARTFQASGFRNLNRNGHYIQTASLMPFKSSKVREAN